MIVNVITDIIEIYVKLFEKIFRGLRVKFRGVRIGPLEFEFKKNSDTSYGKTLEKIETTKTHLNEAISAIDNIKTEIFQKKQELDRLIESLTFSKNQKETVDKEYEVSKRLRDEEAEKLRKVIGLYELKESKTGKVAGFVAGIVASLVAAIIYTIINKYVL